MTENSAVSKHSLKLPVTLYLIWVAILITLAILRYMSI